MSRSQTIVTTNGYNKVNLQPGQRKTLHLQNLQQFFTQTALCVQTCKKLPERGLDHNCGTVYLLILKIVSFTNLCSSISCVVIYNHFQNFSILSKVFLPLQNLTNMMWCDSSIGSTQNQLHILFNKYAFIQLIVTQTLLIKQACLEWWFEWHNYNGWAVHFLLHTYFWVW